MSFFKRFKGCYSTAATLVTILITLQQQISFAALQDTQTNVLYNYTREVFTPYGTHKYSSSSSSLSSSLSDFQLPNISSSSSIDTSFPTDPVKVSDTNTDAIKNSSTTCTCVTFGTKFASNEVCPADPITLQCPCLNENITGINCDRCKENHHNLQMQCLPCDSCYQIVELGVDFYRKHLKNLTDFVDSLENDPNKILDPKFEKQLNELKERVEKMLADAQRTKSMEDDLLAEFESLLNRLKSVRAIIEQVKKQISLVSPILKDGDKNITDAEHFVKSIREALKRAGYDIETDGKTALKKAKERAEKYGLQSQRMSDIAKEARQLADSHQKDANQIYNLTMLAYNHTLRAYELARNASIVQEENAKNIANIKSLIDQVNELLTTTNKMSNEALKDARKSYEEALAFYTLINALQLSSADAAKLKALADEYYAIAKQLKAEIKEFTDRHADLLNKTQFKLNEIRGLLEDAMKQQKITDKQLEDINKTIEEALDAIRKADKILKDAKDTLAILLSFDKMVQESQLEAIDALKKIPAIRNKIKSAEAKTKDTAEKLDKALADATEARDVAVMAFNLANDTSTDLNKIRGDAQILRNRLAILRAETDKLSDNMNSTAAGLDRYELVAKTDGEAALQTLEKANQASASARNATETAKNLLNILNPLLNSIDKLDSIDVNKLSQLEAEYAKLRDKLNDSNIGQNLNDLLAAREEQRRLMQMYKDLIDALRKDVKNIEPIRDSLPDKCFRVERLEVEQNENKK